MILLAVALALGAGWWMGRRRAAAIEAERTIAIDRAMDQLDRRFDDLAGRQLQENIENFLRLARENLGGHQQAAHSSLKEREQAIEALIKPIQESLSRTSEALREIEVERQRDFGSLRQHSHRHARIAGRLAARDAESRAGPQQAPGPRPVGRDCAAAPRSSLPA